MNNLRPTSFDEFIGQNDVKKNLKVFIASSLKRDVPLDHILIHGSTGLGKTSMAYIIAKEMKKKILYLNGTSLQRACDIITPLTKIKNDTILFIDEIHAVSKEVFETLYPVMEDYKLNIIIGKDYNSKTVNIKIPEFTLIGATTEINKISEPMYNRFPIVIHFNDYEKSDIEEIIRITLNKLNIKFHNDVPSKLANNCRDNPRIANNLCKRVYDFYITENIEYVSSEWLDDILNKLGIYKYGLTNIDILYLNTVLNNNWLSLDSISQILNIQSKNILSNIEPILIKKNLVQKTSRGRVITKKGTKYLIEMEQSK